MRITFTVTAEIDPRWILAEVEKSPNFSVDLLRTISARMRSEKVEECENALADALMYKDGIVAGSVTVQRGEA